NAIRALAEIGIDISEAESKPAELFIEDSFDVVVTVCDSAAKDCPRWPGAARIEHWPIVDPSWSGYEAFVATRDDLARRIEQLVESLYGPRARFCRARLRRAEPSRVSGCRPGVRHGA